MLRVTAAMSRRVLGTMFLFLALITLTATLKGVNGCVTPIEQQDFWPTDSDEDASSSGGRLRREVLLSDRLNCLEDDTEPSTRVNTSYRVSALIEEMQARNLDAYIIPSQDEHQSEYVARADKRREFLSGFKGSAGTAVVLANGERALWTDGRYFLAADDQLDCQWLLMKQKKDGVPTLSEWLEEQLASSPSRVGLDPTLISATYYIKLQEKLNDSNIVLVSEQTNLVDLIWENKPPRSKNNLFILEQQFSGEKWTEKVKAVRAEMDKQKADLLVVTALDEVAWLLNLRADDIPYNPVFRSYIMLSDAKMTLFLDSGRITPEVDFHLHVRQCIDGVCFSVTAYDNLVPRLKTAAANPAVRKVLLPKKYSYAGGVSYAVYNAVPSSKRLSAVSPVLELKARKNEVEFQGMKNSHLRDAVALVDFLAFLEKEIEAGNDWDEISAATKLEEYRAEQDHFVGLSFGTISAYGSNGAVIHYKPSNLTKKKITRDSLYLLDSGGQYKDGTTDVTRTLHYGSPTEFQKEAYTRVLMGSIDLAKLVFPKGTGDISVDVLARQHLYQVGLDYNHGTGHGIGMFLNVHEAPVQLRIYSKENHKLQLGYFFSDEPGYYKPFEFGIRLETILAVVKAQTKYESGKDFYEFEPITLVPFEPKLINLDMLDAQQCAYLNAYHDLVRTKVGAALEEQGRMAGLAYLRKKTASVECNNLSGAGRSSSCSSAQAATSNDLQSRFSGDYIIANGALTSCRADSNLVVLLVVLFAILSASRFQ